MKVSVLKRCPFYGMSVLRYFTVTLRNDIAELNKKAKGTEVVQFIKANVSTRNIGKGFVSFKVYHIKQFQAAIEQILRSHFPNRLNNLKVV